jgi:hypothetical protein
MSIHKCSLTLVAAFFLASFLPSGAKAQVNDSQFQSFITSDAQVILDTLNDPFAKGMGFFSSLGWNTPPVIFDFKDGPRVEVGVGLGAQLINLPDLSALTAGVTYLDPGATVNIPTFLPLPFPVATARVGLFNGLDVGGKFTYIPAFDLSAIGIDVAADLTGFGFDVRFKVVDDPLLPTIAVGGSYDVMKGNVTVSTDVNQDFNVNGVDDGHVDGTASYALDWDLQSFGAKVIVGKDLAGFYPFGSIGFQRNSGSVTSTFSGLTTTLDAPGSGTPMALAAVVSAQTPVLFEPKFVLGIDVGEGFKWGLLFESNGVDIAGGTSFKGRF